MALWDTHCHVSAEYYGDILGVFHRALENGVSHFIVSGSNQESNQEVLSFLEKYSFCYGVIGIHPEETDYFQEEHFSFLENNVSHPKILGIGEIGLDYHYTKENREAQISLFERQLKLAEIKHLPVVIHSRDATEDTIKTLKKYHVKGIIHSFSGSLEVAQTYIKMGYKLGINGVVTFKNSKLKTILKEIFPFIVLETDSPFLTPHPYRGTRNEPKYIRNIAEFIAENLNISIDQVEKVTNQNISAIFDKLE